MTLQASRVLETLSDLLLDVAGDGVGNGGIERHPSAAAMVETVGSFVSCLAEDLEHVARRRESDAAAMLRLVQTTSGILADLGVSKHTREYWQGLIEKHQERWEREEGPSAVGEAAGASRGPSVYCQGEELP